MLEVFAAAGEGLAAAHAAGVVHRDFKPDNVMVDQRGRARVLDLGLSAALASQTIPSSPSARVTEAGAFIGTPAYASPEQFEQKVADARSDQFSFCIALYEALCGARPFAGRTFASLSAAVTSTDPARPSRRAIPARLWRVLRRGLARRPQERWPDMPALLGALRQRSRTRLLAVTVFAAAAATVAAWPSARSAQCDGGQRVAQARTDVLASLDPETAAGASARLQEWARAYDKTCNDVEHGPRTRQCLDLQLASIDAALASIEASTPAERRNAPMVVEAMPWPGRCAAAPSAGAPELIRRLSAVRAAQRLGRGAEVLEEARAIVAEATAAGDDRTAALGLHAVGSIEEDLGRYGNAVEVLEQALWSGRDSADPAEVARIATRLVTVLIRLGEVARARTVLELGVEASLRSDNPTLAADVAVARCRVLDRSGEFEAAIEAGEQAVQLARVSDPARPIQLSVALSALAMPTFRVGRHADADALVEEAAGIVEQHLGAAHPRALTLRCRQSMHALQLGQPERGRELAQAVVDTVNEHLSPTHPLAGCGHTNLGTYHHAAGRAPEAREHWELALEAHLATYGFEHINTAAHHTNIGNTYVVEGRWDEALEHFERARRIRERAVGPDHPENAFALVGIGQAHVSDERPEAAIPPLRQALHLYERYGTDPLRLGIAHWYLGRALWSSTRDWQGAVHNHIALDQFVRAGPAGKPWIRDLLEQMQAAPPPLEKKIAAP